MVDDPKGLQESWDLEAQLLRLQQRIFPLDEVHPVVHLLIELKSLEILESMLEVARLVTVWKRTWGNLDLFFH